MPKKIIIAEQERIAALLSDERVDKLIVAQGRYQIGNSVPPILAKVIAKQLADVLLGNKIYGESPESIQGELF